MIKRLKDKGKIPPRSGGSNGAPGTFSQEFELIWARGTLYITKLCWFMTKFIVFIENSDPDFFDLFHWALEVGYPLDIP